MTRRTAARLTTLLAAAVTALTTAAALPAAANQPPNPPPTEAPENSALAPINGETTPANCTTSTAKPAGQSKTMRQLCEEAVAAAPTYEAEKAIKYAFSKLGTPYSQDVTLRATTHFDCSSFIGRAYSAAGAQIKRYNGTYADFYHYFSWTGAYIPQGTFSSGYRYGYEGTNVSRVSSNSLKPGDIIIQFNGSDPGNSAGNAGHAQMYLGGGLIIQSGGGGDSRVNVARTGNYLQNQWFFRYNTLGTPKNGTTPTPQPPTQTPPPVATLFPQREAGRPAPAGSVTLLRTTPNAVAMGNATVINPTADGYLTAWPCSEERPTAATAVYSAGHTKANFVFAKADGNGNVCIYNSTETHLAWDHTMTTLVMAGHNNVRKMDSRTPSSPTAGAPLAARGTLRIPTGAVGKNAVGTLSAIDPQGEGWAVAWPCDQPRPNSSNVNFQAGKRASNMLVVRPDQNGDICVYTSAAAHITWDQMSETITIPDASPVRKLDTRLFVPEMTPGPRTLRFKVGAGDELSFGNITAVSPVGPGHATVYPCAEGKPAASSLNFDPANARTVANLAAAVTDSEGYICVYISTGVHIVWDQISQTDWYRPDGAPVRAFDTRTG